MRIESCKEFVDALFGITVEYGVQAYGGVFGWQPDSEPESEEAEKMMDPAPMLSQTLGLDSVTPQVDCSVTAG